MFETRLGILVQTLIWETSKHGQRGAILLGGRELVRGLRGTRTFHLFHLFCKFPWIFAWVGFVGVALLVCLFLLAFAFGEICFLSSLIPVVDRQCLALVRQCREKKKQNMYRALTFRRKVCRVRDCKLLECVSWKSYLMPVALFRTKKSDLS